MSDIANLKDTIVPKSDQLNAEQLLSGPMTITVTEVKRGAPDQPIAIHYSGDDGRPYKPCKTMRKVLIFAWGDDGREWAGKSMTMYCDPDVKFGGVKVGGIRISHLSHIKNDIAISLNSTKGKKSEFVIHKLTMGRGVAELRSILEFAAGKGTKALRVAWLKEMNDSERTQMGESCPVEYKTAAAAADAEMIKEQA